MIRTIIAEDNTYMQNHLVNMLQNAGDFEVMASFVDAFEAEKYCASHSVELVVMDVQTQHNHNGLAAASRLREGGNVKVVVVTSLIDPDVLVQAKQGAADSLWYKDHGEAELLDVIRRTVQGEHIFPETSPNVELNQMFSGDLTPRQIQILRRFVQGYTYDEIAEELHLSKNGVRWNLDAMVEKGGFKNKHELLAAVIENKLIVTTLKD